MQVCWHLRPEQWEDKLFLRTHYKNDDKDMEIDMPTFFNKTENCPRKEIRSSFLYNE